jgi:hypothetical protein
MKKIGDALVVAIAAILFVPAAILAFPLSIIYAAHRLALKAVDSL